MHKCGAEEIRQRDLNLTEFETWRQQLGISDQCASPLYCIYLLSDVAQTRLEPVYRPVTSKGRSRHGLLSINHLHNRRCLTRWLHTASNITTDSIASIHKMLTTRTNLNTARNFKKILYEAMPAGHSSLRGPEENIRLGCLSFGSPAGSMPVNNGSPRMIYTIFMEKHIILGAEEKPQSQRRKSSFLSCPMGSGQGKKELYSRELSLPVH